MGTDGRTNQLTDRRTEEVSNPPALESQINLRMYPKYIWDIFRDIFKIYPRFIWDMNAFGIYPRYIPDVSLIYTTCCTNNIPDSSDISDLSRIYPGFILDNRFIWDLSVYLANIQDSKWPYGLRYYRYSAAGLILERARMPVTLFSWRAHWKFTDCARLAH
jgi:hypothetical protein